MRLEDVPELAPPDAKRVVRVGYFSFEDGGDVFAAVLDSHFKPWHRRPTVEA